MSDRVGVVVDGVVVEHTMPQDDEVAMLEQMYGPMEFWNEEGVFNPGL